MTVVLHFGVIEQPYTSYDAGRKAADPKRRRAKAPVVKHAARTVSTGQVAEWLEDRYHVMEVFYESDAGAMPLLKQSLQDALEDVLMGAPVGANPFLGATSEIQARFKQFISGRAMEMLGIPGVPTEAALMGVNHRLKRRRGPRRPSFRDTGLYEASFQAWVD